VLYQVIHDCLETLKIHPFLIVFTERSLQEGGKQMAAAKHNLIVPL